MIKYHLHCPQGHEFDAWFSDSDAFEEQRNAGLIDCPGCGSTEVEKTLMAPSIAPGRASGKPAQMFRPDPREAKLRAMMQQLRDHVVANADYVGDKFAEEARRIHYEEAENRGIYGEAAPEEARELIEEGIPVHPLPVIPDEQN